MFRRELVRVAGTAGQRGAVAGASPNPQRPCCPASDGVLAKRKASVDDSTRVAQL